MRTQRNPVRALDKLDHKILNILQKDGRVAMKDLAEQVGLSVTPCIERVNGWSATASSWATTRA